jgi:AcrR family transcriptional regulator
MRKGEGALPRKRAGTKRGAPSKTDKSERRIGGENSKTRALLLDTAERLMREEGYAAVTSRRLASKAGLSRQLVHYYFRTMDDLFLALWRQYADKSLASQAQALASPRPLRALWEHGSDEWITALYIEFMALANHRKTIRAELGHTGERYRVMQMGALSQIVADHDLPADLKSPEVLAILISALSRGLVLEKQVGMSGGHARTLELVDRWLSRSEGRRARGRKMDKR